MSTANELVSKQAAADGVAVVQKAADKSKGKPMRYAIMLAYQGKKYFGMQASRSPPFFLLCFVFRFKRTPQR